MEEIGDKLAIQHKYSVPCVLITLKFIHMKKSFIFLLIFTYSFSFAQNSDCLVDTIGYSSFLQTLNPVEDATFQLHVNGSFAVAYGVIGRNTPNIVQDLIDNYPLVTTIIMYACPGSNDDDANLEASILIHNHGYKMYLPLDGWVASGATDMFLAGSLRVVEVTVESVGVHSWSSGTKEATDYPVGDAVHKPYIDYYINIGFTQQEAEDFYYFTINSATANGIYWMTEAEIDKYKIRTCYHSTNLINSITHDDNCLDTTILRK